MKCDSCQMSCLNVSGGNLGFVIHAVIGWAMTITFWLDLLGFSGSCLRSLVSTSSGNMFTGCNITSTGAFNDDIAQARVDLCASNTFSAVGFFTDVSNTDPAAGDWYTCNTGQQVEMVACDLTQIRSNDGACFETFVELEYFKVTLPVF